MKYLTIILFSIFIASCKQESKENTSTPKNLSEIDADENFADKNKTTYYFIRHAEKDRKAETNDPHLTSVGMDRANQWAKILANKDIEIVYSTSYQRTIETATPTADTVKTTIEFYKPSKLYTKEFQRKTAGKTVLVVGHSDTTPLFINKILGEDKYKDIPDDENGNLYTVIIHPNGRKESLLENFPLSQKVTD